MVMDAELLDADGGITRHFRSRAQMAVFNMTRTAIEESVVGSWVDAHGYEPDPLPQLETAVETMLHVSQAIRLPRYRLLEYYHDRLPKTSGEALDTGIGLCGQQTQVFACLARSFGLDVRQVGFRFETERGEETHATVEVVINGGWRFMDVTWCSYWVDEAGDLLSVDEVVDLPVRSSGRVSNSPLMLASSYRMIGRDPFAYLDGERWILKYNELVIA